MICGNIGINKIRLTKLSEDVIFIIPKRAKENQIYYLSIEIVGYFRNNEIIALSILNDQKKQNEKRLKEILNNHELVKNNNTK